MKYFELTGEKRLAALEILRSRVEAKERALKFAESFGGNGYFTGGFFDQSVVAIAFKAGRMPSPVLLRKHYDQRKKKHDEFYVPNRSSKEGRDVAKRMQELHIPGGTEIAKLIGMTIWGRDLSYQVPGISVFGSKKRVIVEVPDNVTIKDATRISDVEFEKLDKPKRKTKTQKS